MLIDDSEVAINEIIVVCQEVADHYTDACDHVNEDNLKSLFDFLAVQRRQSAEDLSRIIRNQGGLPRDADVELEQLQFLWSHIKLLMGDPDDSLRQTLILQEGRLQQIIDSVLATSLSGDSRRIIEQIQADSKTALARLEQSQS